MISCWSFLSLFFFSYLFLSLFSFFLFFFFLLRLAGCHTFVVSALWPAESLCWRCFISLTSRAVPKSATCGARGPSVLQALHGRRARTLRTLSSVINRLAVLMSLKKNKTKKKQGKSETKTKMFWKQPTDATCSSNAKN